MNIDDFSDILADITYMGIALAYLILATFHVLAKWKNERVIPPWPFYWLVFHFGIQFLGFFTLTAVVGKTRFYYFMPIDPVLLVRIVFFLIGQSLWARVFFVAWYLYSLRRDVEDEYIERWERISNEKSL